MNITTYLDLIIGFILVLTVGFFMMEFILAAITLATGFDKGKQAYEAASKQMSAAFKGLLIVAVTYILLNSILGVFGISTSTANITTTLGNYMDNLGKCLRDFKQCN